MGVVITREDIKAYAEVDYIIHHMNIRYIEMLPKKILNFFDAMKDPTYEVYVDPHKPLQNQGLQRYTLEIIALLHLKYWCQDEERKKELYNRMQTNQKNFEEKLKENLGFDNAFEEELEEKEDYSKPKKLNVIKQEEKAIEEKSEEIISEDKNENIEKDKTQKLTTEVKKNPFVNFLNRIKKIFCSDKK